MKVSEIMECVKAGYKPSEIAELAAQLKEADPDEQSQEHEENIHEDEENLQESKESQQADQQESQQESQQADEKDSKIKELEEQLKAAQQKNVNTDNSDKNQKPESEKLADIVKGFF